LDRERLVALAVLLGCDYLPRGVPSVGRDLAMKFFSSLTAVDSVLERYAQNSFIFRSTLKSRPNKVGLGCPYVLPSTKLFLIPMKFGM